MPAYILHPYEEGMCGNREFQSGGLGLTQQLFKLCGLLPLSGGTVKVYTSLCIYVNTDSVEKILLIQLNGKIFNQKNSRIGFVINFYIPNKTVPLLYDLIMCNFS